MIRMTMSDGHLPKVVQAVAQSPQAGVENVDRCRVPPTDVDQQDVAVGVLQDKGIDGQRRFGQIDQDPPDAFGDLFWNATQLFTSQRSSLQPGKHVRNDFISIDLLE